MPDRAAQPETAPESRLEVTPEMIEVGAEAILSRVGGADLGGYFSAPRLAEQVYRAMASKRCLGGDGPSEQA